MNFKVFFSTICLLLSQLCYAEDAELAKVFEKYEKEGTIVISSLDGKQTYIHNDQRANQRLSPASTFKIVNTLIALEEKILSDENHKILWDGKERDFEAWNKDQTLDSAFKSSCLWAFQWIARNVGTDVYVKHLTHMAYGNKTPGPELTSFWLVGGGLKITPLEQVDVIRNIYFKKYNFSDHAYNTLKKIMFTDKTETYDLYVKTGASTQDWIGHGWYVGYVIVNGTPWFFATNMKVNGFKDLALRAQITLDCLKSKRII
jgi:beta-lactamase class D